MDLVEAYQTALKTIGNSGLPLIDAIFKYCVFALVALAKWLGVSYEEVNVWIFVIIWPIITIALIVWIVILRRKVKKLKKQLS